MNCRYGCERRTTVCHRCALEAAKGRDVTLSLRFADGRTRELTGRLLSVGDGGGVVDAACWPTSFKHSEVVSVTA